jgi:trehalose 6-phosphate phosphatase
VKGAREAVGEALTAARLIELAPRDVLLVTDFDGTLSEVVSDPGQATILPMSVQALRRLTGTLGHVAVLSSRSTADLRQRIPIEGAEIIGDSGLGDMASDERRRLEMFNVEAARTLADVPGVWLETKLSGTAVHHRHAQVHPSEILHRIGPALRETGLHVQVGRRVIEVMPRERPKGDALAGLIVRLQPRGVVCLGDDENDRPMFDYVNALSRPHLTVGVASDEARADLFEGCDLVVSGPPEVGELLSALADWASTPSP